MINPQDFFLCCEINNKIIIKKYVHKYFKLGPQAECFYMKTSVAIPDIADCHSICNSTEVGRVQAGSNSQRYEETMNKVYIYLPSVSCPMIQSYVSLR